MAISPDEIDELLTIINSSETCSINAGVGNHKSQMVKCFIITKRRCS